jgi:hypothetical protein
VDLVDAGFAGARGRGVFALALVEESQVEHRAAAANSGAHPREAKTGRSARAHHTARTYLEERFTFHAPERTTEEFLRELAGTNLLLPEQKESLGNFLASCDLVKFAKYEPGENELRELHGSAVRLVEETEPQPVSNSGSQIENAETSLAAIEPEEIVNRKS